jgi:hypothetical protein
MIIALFVVVQRGGRLCLFAFFLCVVVMTAQDVNRIVVFAMNIVFDVFFLLFIAAFKAIFPNGAFVHPLALIKAVFPAAASSSLVALWLVD